MKYERFSWKTEKLQNLNDEILLVVDNTNKEWKGHVLNVIDLLNSLAEENEQLKQQIKIEKKWQLEKDRYYVDLHKKYDKLEKENEQLQKEKEYYREYALQYLLEYDLYTDNFLNDIKDIIGEEGVKRVKEKQNKIIEALKKEGLYE